MGIFDAIGNLFGGGSHMSPGGVPIPQPKPAPQASSPFMLQNPRDMNALSKFGFLMRSAGDPNFAMNYSLMLSAQEKEQRELEKEQAMQEWLQGADLPDNVRSLAQFDPSIAGKYILQENDPYRKMQAELMGAQLADFGRKNQMREDQGRIFANMMPGGTALSNYQPPPGAPYLAQPQGGMGPQPGQHLAGLKQLAERYPEQYGDKYLNALEEFNKPKVSYKPVTDADGNPIGQMNTLTGQVTSDPRVRAAKEARDRQAEEKAMQAKRQDALQQAYALQEDIADFKGFVAEKGSEFSLSDFAEKGLPVGGIFGGLESALDFTGGTDSSIAEGRLDSIKSRVVLDAMRRLKEASPTGATGFGSMNEREFGSLEASTGKMSLGDIENTMRILDRLDELSARTIRDLGGDNGAADKIKNDHGNVDDLLNKYGVK